MFRPHCCRCCLQKLQFCIDIIYILKRHFYIHTFVSSLTLLCFSINFTFSQCVPCLHGKYFCELAFGSIKRKQVNEDLLQSRKSLMEHRVLLFIKYTRRFSDREFFHCFLVVCTSIYYIDLYTKPSMLAVVDGLQSYSNQN